MSIIIGVCPNCVGVVTTKKRDLFFSCHNCEENVPLRHAVTFLREMCEDPGCIDDVLKLCLSIEKDVEVEIPLGIMTLLKDAHPYNEHVYYTYMRIAGYPPDVVRHYLKTFSEVKGQKPWAREFLDNAMHGDNMYIHSLFTEYIARKIPQNKQREYFERLANLKENYTKGVGEGEGVFSMHMLYLLGIALNIGMIVFVFVVGLAFLFNFLIGIAVIGLQLGAIFVHNRIYGNRLGISGIELIFVCVFLSSFVLAIAGVVIGALV